MRAADVSDFWDNVVNRFLRGQSELPKELAEWRAAYHGRRDGAVEERTLPEPFLGDLAGRPRAVFLALNPGRADLDFQSRTGLFASEIRQLGSYHAWAATWPYLRDPWESSKGQNRHLQSRLKFMRSWFDDPSMSADLMTSFELYPWHSARITASLRPRADVIREYVWEPIADLGAPFVFAFGASWFQLLPELGVGAIATLGRGGSTYASSVSSRSVLIGSSTAGSVVIAEKHAGSAGPPSPDETTRMREAVARVV